MFKLIIEYLNIPALGSIFLLTLFILLLIEIILYLRDYKYTTDVDQGTRNIIYSLIAAGILIGFISLKLQFLLWSEDPLKLLSIGLSLIWCGILLRSWAILSLGKFFRTVIISQKGQNIRESGIYQYIRHPSYLGDFIIIFGLAILFGNWIGFCGLIILGSIGLFWRMNLEEKYLISQFGEEYLSYMKRTYRLIPKIY